ncbi:TPA: Rha family transcriptional regulator [Yersinia enterocolitica]|uniref:Rha family transcriptional regulator n=1 Tax=Yersinia enterocolitica TaxID=630 RepID=UPI00296398F9|nr:Rha family transcriptional regulator [Yersinia enterocolitica]HEF7275745.1 Rha family transcriptional regulator [Yersinia enterocolitica]HEK6332676.1 Rha family transcriptional regulator [Yersinia enterocolitica]
MKHAISTTIDFDFKKFLAVDAGEVMTDTMQVAKAFNKRHADVLRAVDRMHCSVEFRQAHFCVSEKINELGVFDKKQRYFRMDFSGFVMLVMGFNGPAAATVKEAYINAFNWMTGELKKYREGYEAERNAVMLEYMKEKDVASMSGRLLNRWGKKTKPRLTARIEQLDKNGQVTIPGLIDKAA